MKKLIALVALFGMTTSLASASGHWFMDWDRSGSAIDLMAPETKNFDGIAVLTTTNERRYDHPGVGDRDPGAAKFGNIEYDD
jgi:hypothetical protein